MIDESSHTVCALSAKIISVCGRCCKVTISASYGMVDWPYQCLSVTACHSKDKLSVTFGSVTGSLVMPPAREIRFCLNLSLSFGNWWLSTGKLLHRKPYSKQDTS